MGRPSINFSKRAVVWVATCILLLVPRILLAEVEQADAVLRSTEYELKAAYIYHFLNFIKWPESQYRFRSKTITICVLGPNPFGKHLKALSKRTINGRQIKTHVTDSLTKVSECHLVYIAGNRRPYQDNVLKLLRRKQILSIGETRYFVKAGGAIALVIEDGRVRCHVNMTVTKEMGYRLSAKLLEVSKIVEDDS